MTSSSHRFWLELREPGKVPVLKGPFNAPLARTLREFMSARPRAFITVITIADDGTPLLEDGPEALISADFRSVSTARKHISSTARAFADVSASRFPLSLVKP